MLQQLLDWFRSLWRDDEPVINDLEWEENLRMKYGIAEPLADEDE